MAKPKPDPQPQRADAASKATEEPPSEAKSPPKPEVSKPVTKPVKKAAAAPRSKKQNGAASKSGSLLPSADKLEQLKAAVTAAGSAENLVLILQHVDQAGGIPEVIESIEAYQTLKDVLE